MFGLLGELPSHWISVYHICHGLRRLGTNDMPSLLLKRGGRKWRRGFRQGRLAVSMVSLAQNSRRPDSLWEASNRLGRSRHGVGNAIHGGQ